MNRIYACMCIADGDGRCIIRFTPWKMCVCILWRVNTKFHCTHKIISFHESVGLASADDNWQPKRKGNEEIPPPPRINFKSKDKHNEMELKMAHGEHYYVSAKWSSSLRYFFQDEKEKHWDEMKKWNRMMHNEMEWDGWKITSIPIMSTFNVYMHWT